MAIGQQQSLIERDIDTLYQQARNGEMRGKRAATARKILAYSLKVVAGGGSLAVATGYFSEWHQLIGVAILVAIFLDTVSSNHKRLLSEAQAGYAYQFLRENVSRQYNRKLDSLLRVINLPGPATDAREKAQQDIYELQGKTHEQLAEGVSQIRQGLAAADLKALEALSLDNERAAASSG